MRSTRKSTLAGLALGCALALLAGCPATDVSPPPVRSRTGLFVSDIHFNPLADKALADRLAHAPARDWDAIFATSAATGYSGAGADTNVLLLDSALAAMRARVPDPDIVFVSGDLLVHEFPVLFALEVTDHSAAAYTAFVDTTEQYVAAKLAAAFPRAQIVPTLGDWDTAGRTDTYASQAFLAAYAAAWSGAVDRHGDAPGFATSFPTRGYYSTAFPVDPQARLVVLYTQPWAAECTVGCAPGAGSAGDAELEWLAAEFDDARRHGQRVWLLGHIPPGINAATTAQNTAKGLACTAAIAPFYADTYAQRLDALVLANRDLVAFGIFAHEHDDDFRLMNDAAGVPLFAVKLVPSITPLDGNNPAFVAFAYDPVAGQITDAATWYLANLPAATTTNPGVWSLEYRFDSTYGQRAFDSPGIAAAVQRIRTEDGARATYTANFPSSNPAGLPPGGFTPFLPYSCALAHVTVADYGACYCGN